MEIDCGSSMPATRSCSAELKRKHDFMNNLLPPSSKNANRRPRTAEEKPVFIQETNELQNLQSMRPKSGSEIPRRKPMRETSPFPVDVDLDEDDDEDEGSSFANTMIDPFDDTKELKIGHSSLQDGQEMRPQLSQHETATKNSSGFHAGERKESVINKQDLESLSNISCSSFAPSVSGSNSQPKLYDQIVEDDLGSALSHSSNPSHESSHVHRSSFWPDSRTDSLSTIPSSAHLYCGSTQHNSKPLSICQVLGKGNQWALNSQTINLLEESEDHLYLTQARHQGQNPSMNNIRRDQNLSEWEKDSNFASDEKQYFNHLNTDAAASPSLSPSCNAEMSRLSSVEDNAQARSVSSEILPGHERDYSILSSHLMQPVFPVEKVETLVNEQSVEVDQHDGPSALEPSHLPSEATIVHTRRVAAPTFVKPVHLGGKPAKLRSAASPALHPSLESSNAKAESSSEEVSNPELNVLLPSHFGSPNSLFVRQRQDSYQKRPNTLRVSHGSMAPQALQSDGDKFSLNSGHSSTSDRLISQATTNPLRGSESNNSIQNAIKLRSLEEQSIVSNRNFAALKLQEASQQRVGSEQTSGTDDNSHEAMSTTYVQPCHNSDLPPSPFTAHTSKTPASENTDGFPQYSQAQMGIPDATKDKIWRERVKEAQVQLDEDDVEIVEEEMQWDEQIDLLFIRNRLVHEVTELAPRWPTVRKSLVRHSGHERDGTPEPFLNHNGKESNIILESDKDRRKRQEAIESRFREMTVEVLGKAEMAYASINIWTESRKGKWIVRNSAPKDGKRVVEEYILN